MNELQALEKLKIATAVDIRDILNKNVGSVKRQLKTWIKLGEIKSIIIEKHTDYNKSRRYYITNEIYKDYFKENEY